MDWDIAEIRERIRQLQRRRPAIFGADGHRFRLQPPAAEDAVREFEQHHRIVLPADYRAFITQIGNGGMGPYYGVFPLGIMDDGHDFKPWAEAAGLLGTLAEPFPHTSAWNDLAGNPDESLIESDEDEYWRQTEAFESRYWSGTVMNGAMPICHVGCAQRVWLVVTGPEAGNIWQDERTDLGGVSPLSFPPPDHPRITFLEWYQRWLDASLGTDVGS